MYLTLHFVQSDVAYTREVTLMVPVHHLLVVVGCDVSALTRCAGPPAFGMAFLTYVLDS